MLLAVTHPSSTEPPAFDPASRTALATFVRRRIKLSRNLLLWRRFAQAEVAELVVRIVRSIILPSATRTWQSGGAETAAMVSLYIFVCEAVAYSRSHRTGIGSLACRNFRRAAAECAPQRSCAVTQSVGSASRSSWTSPSGFVSSLPYRTRCNGVIKQYMIRRRSGARAFLKHI